MQDAALALTGGVAVWHGIPAETAPDLSPERGL